MPLVESVFVLQLSKLEGIRQSEKWNYVEVDSHLMERGFELFRQMKDKEWRLVDCVSIIVARELNITEIFTNDHHFTQADFQLLLQDP